MANMSQQHDKQQRDSAAYSELYANALRVVNQRDLDIAFLKQERDELLAALDNYLPEADHSSDKGVRYYGELLEVIDRVKGENNG